MDSYTYLYLFKKFLVRLQDGWTDRWREKMGRVGRCPLSNLTFLPQDPSHCGFNRSISCLTGSPQQLWVPELVVGTLAPNPGLCKGHRKWKNYQQSIAWAAAESHPTASETANYEQGRDQAKASTCPTSCFFFQGWVLNSPWILGVELHLLLNQWWVRLRQNRDWRAPRVEGGRSAGEKSVSVLPGEGGSQAPSELKIGQQLPRSWKNTWVKAPQSSGLQGLPWSQSPLTYVVTLNIHFPELWKEI